LLSKFSNSPALIASIVYPYHEWIPWKFNASPHNWWRKDPSKEGHRKYLTWLGDLLGFKSYNDWYKISNMAMRRNNGSSLLRQYKSSARHAVMAVFNEHQWSEWKFDSVPRGWWKNKANQRKFMDWAIKQLNITDFEQYYKLTKAEIVKLGGSSTFKPQRPVN